MFQDPINQDFIYSDNMPYSLHKKLEESSEKVGILDQETINRINKEEESKLNPGPSSLNPSSALKKVDPPEMQEKIIKMIQSGIQKNKSDKEIMKKIKKMSDGKNTYKYNRKTGEVNVTGEHPREGKGTENQGDYEPSYDGGD